MNYKFDDYTYNDLLKENYYLKKRLEEVEKEYSDFVSKMANASSNVTTAWVNEILSGNLQIK